jgi:hypothetical protein
MIRTDAITCELNADCIAVLERYAVRETAVKALNDPEHSGWLERIDQMPDMEDCDLTSAHGKLIAEGLLKFEVTGRCQGLQYQLSPLARHLLASRQDSAATSDEVAADADLCGQEVASHA